MTEIVTRAVQARTDPSGRGVFRYGGRGETYIDRFFNGTWHTYGPFPKR